MRSGVRIPKLPEQTIKHYPTSGFTVLVVEDEFLVRLDMADHLSDAGYNVIEAAHAAGAMKVLEGEGVIHLLLTDVDMPGAMDGLKLAAIVAARWPLIKIIVVSGHRIVTSGQIPDGSLFFSKPYSPAVIEAAMQNLLQQLPSNGRPSA